MYRRIKMSVINDLINIESDSLDFGNYELATKTKIFWVLNPSES